MLLFNDMCIESGHVKRPTMAEVIVNRNSTILMFQENFTVASLWAGIINA